MITSAWALNFDYKFVRFRCTELSFECCLHVWTYILSMIILILLRSVNNIK